jgi:hypothetical protein
MSSAFIHRKKRDTGSQNIFANRNSIYRRYHQITRVKEISLDEEEETNSRKKFELFKNKLTNYIHKDEEKDVEEVF